MRKKIPCLVFVLFILIITSCRLKSEPSSVEVVSTPEVNDKPIDLVIPPTLELPPEDDISEIHSSNGIPESLSTLRIVYTDNDQLWIWEHGESRLLTESNEYSNPFDTDHVAISDDGKLIAFGTGYWGDQVHVININGSDERVVVEGEKFSAEHDAGPLTILYKLGWIPETHRLIVDTSVWIQTGMYSPGRTQMVFNVDDSNMQVIDNSDLYFPSPNGRLIAAIDSESISVMNSDGSSRHTVFTFGSPGGWVYSFPVWGKESNSIALAIPSSETQSPSSVWQIVVDPLDVSLLAEIEHWSGSHSNGVISPDFSYLIYFEKPNLYLRNLGLSDDRSLYSGDLFGEVIWAPDASKFLFLTTADDDNVMIGSISDGGEVDPLEGLHASVIDWIDSDNILFFNSNEIGIWNVDEGVSIHLVDIDGWYPLFSKYDFYID